MSPADLTENLPKQLILKMTQSTEVGESSICRRPTMSLILPSPHSHYSKSISTFRSAFLMSFSLTHFAALHDEHAGATSRLPFSPICKSFITPPDALMPHTPVCNEMYEADLLNPAVADRIWYTYKCISSWQLPCLNPKSSNVASTAFRPADEFHVHGRNSTPSMLQDMDATARSCGEANWDFLSET